MYKIIATNDFVELLSELPLKYTSFLRKSFISVEKLEDKNDRENTFINDLANLKGE